jgi:hypothetical protein
VLEAQVKVLANDDFRGMEDLRPQEKMSGSFSPWMGSAQTKHRGECTDRRPVKAPVSVRGVYSQN